MRWYENYGGVQVSVYEEHEIDKGFSRAHAHAREASRIVKLSGPNVPGPLGLPPEREEFLKVVEETIAERLRDPRAKPLNYQVVVPSSSTPLQSTLTREQIDLPMYQHCGKVFELLSRERDQSKVEFDLYIHEPLAACPALLVLDNTVYLLITTERGRVLDRKMVTEVTPRSSIVIEDPSGRVAEHYVRVIQNLMAKGVAIKQVRKTEESD